MSLDNIYAKKKYKKRKCSVEEVYASSVEKHTANPILVTFRTACPSNISLEAHLSKERYHEGAQVGHKYVSQVSIMDEHNRVYSGQNKTSRTEDCQEMVFVGLLNKRTGKLKLVEAEQFAVSRVLDSHAEQTLKTVNTELETNVNVEFGTKKNINRHKQLMLEKARQSTEVLSGIQSASEVVTQQNVTASIDTDYSYIVPHINEEASTPDEVYTMSSVVTDAILECLIDEASVLLEAKLPYSESVSSLFLMSLAIAKLEADEDTRLRHACASIYLEYLCCVASGRPLKRENMKPTVLHHLQHTYNVGRKFVGATSRDRALAHLLVLTMLINRCRVPLSTLVNSVAVVKKKLVMFARVLRLKVLKDELVLQLPLPSISEGSYKRIEFTKSKRMQT